jgi:hypothetical protein
MQMRTSPSNWSEESGIVLVTEADPLTSKKDNCYQVQLVSSAVHPFFVPQDHQAPHQNLKPSF